MSSVEVGIDEFTLVLLPPDKVDVFKWEEHGEAIITRFLELSRLEDLFGKMTEATGKIQAGYTQGLTFENRPWHFGIFWHENHPGMGICVKFSAWAWAVYVQDYEAKYGTEMTAAVFLQMVTHDDYTMRLSRIDLTVDYIDYPDPVNPVEYLSPDTLYRGLEAGNYAVVFTDGRGCLRKIQTRSAISKNGKFETFYIGGRKGKAQTFLRVYDKKQEQLDHNGFQIDKAQRAKSWTRFEAVFKHDYAHQIGNCLLDPSMSKIVLQSYIAAVVANRYTFMDTSTGEAMDISDDLAGIANGTQADALSRPNTRDNDLLQSIEHLRSHSGLYATLYKASQVWPNGDIDLMDYLLTDYLYTFKEKVETGRYKSMKRELDYWIFTHKDELGKIKLKDYLPKLVSYGDPLDPYPPKVTPLIDSGPQDATA